MGFKCWRFDRLPFVDLFWQRAKAHNVRFGISLRWPKISLYQFKIYFKINCFTPLPTQHHCFYHSFNANNINFGGGTSLRLKDQFYATTSDDYNNATNTTSMTPMMTTKIKPTMSITMTVTTTSVTTKIDRVSIDDDRRLTNTTATTMMTTIVVRGDDEQKDEKRRFEWKEPIFKIHLPH